MIRIGTRPSRLALVQANLVRDALVACGEDARIVEISSHGDTDQDTPLAALGMTNIFTNRLETALFEGEVDLGVHSLKDMASSVPAGLLIAACLGREDPRDVLIGRHAALDALPGAPLIATGSPRRRAFLRAKLGECNFVEIRGNIETRLDRFESSEADCMILAAAGLKRLGLEARIAGYLDTTTMIPAAGQGIIAVECREDDSRARELAASLDDPDAAACARAERNLMDGLDAGCQAPIGAHAIILDGTLTLHSAVFATEGADAVYGTVSGAGADGLDAAGHSVGVQPLEDSISGVPGNADVLGQELAKRLLSRGARDMLTRVTRSS